MRIAVYYFCPKRFSETRFASFCLGHLNGRDTDRKPNPAATQHYYHYCLVDDSGSDIEAKGIKLETNENIFASVTSAQPVVSKPSQSANPVVSSIPANTNLITNELMEIIISDYRNRIAQLETENAALKAELASLKHTRPAAVLTHSQPAATPTAVEAPVAVVSQPSTPLPVQQPKAPAMKAEDKLEKAFRAILDWNDSPDTDGTWKITEGLLFDLTGCNRPAVKRFFDEHESVINDEHQNRGIVSDLHNRGRSKEALKNFMNNRVY